MIKIEYSRRFKKKLDRYNPRQKKRIKEKVWVFAKDPYSPLLKTHQLTGKLKGYWAFSVEYNLRIMFRFGGNDTAEFVDVGTHEIYK